MTVTLEFDLAPVAFPDAEHRCAFCGRPGADVPVLVPCDDEVALAAGYVPPDLAGPLTPCCDRHELAMCEPCRDLKGSGEHRDPRESA